MYTHISSDVINVEGAGYLGHSGMALGYDPRYTNTTWDESPTVTYCEYLDCDGNLWAYTGGSNYTVTADPLYDWDIYVDPVFYAPAGAPPVHTCAMAPWDDSDDLPF